MHFLAVRWVQRKSTENRKTSTCPQWKCRLLSKVSNRKIFVTYRMTHFVFVHFRVHPDYPDFSNTSPSQTSPTLQPHFTQASLIFTLHPDFTQTSSIHTSPPLHLSDFPCTVPECTSHKLLFMFYFRKCQHVVSMYVR